MLRTTLVVGAAAVAACANAQISLIVVSDGTATLTPPSLLTEVDTVVAQTPADGLTTYVSNIDVFTGVGTATYTGTMGNLNVDLNMALANLVNAPSSQSIDGTWSYAGGTGIFAGLTGGGTLATTFLTTGTPIFLVGTELSGTLNAVPEPAPIAALGLGALGLLIQRRRKA